MTDKQKKIAMIVGGIVVVVGGGVAYYLTTKPNSSTSLLPGAGSGSASSGSSTPSVQNILNAAQAGAQTAAQTVSQVQQALSPSSPSTSSSSSGLKDGQGIRVTDGPYNGYVYLYSVGELGPIKQWVTSSALLMKYFGNSNLNTLISTGKVVNVSSAVANAIPEAGKLLNGLGDPYPSQNLRGLFS